MPSYKVNDQVFTIPDDKIDLFEADFPEAQLQYKVNDGTSFTIPANKRVDFLADFPDAQEVGWEPLQASEPQTIASNETIIEQQTVPQEEKLRGFRAGARESWKGLKAGTQFAYGEVANALFGSSDNDANALYKLDEMLREGKDVNAEVEGAWTDAGREIRTGVLEFLPGWMIKGWKERVHEEAAQQKILDDIRDVIGEAGGDIAKARELLVARASDKSYGDIQKEKAKEKFADVQETEGLGAWVGENAVQMIPSASALIVGALTKSPGAARAIGMIGMGGMTAATAGSSMYEAREAGASDLETRKVGVVDGALEYITEKLPFDNYTNWMMGKAKSKVTTNLAKALRSGNTPLRSELEELLKAANKELGGKLFSKKNLSEYIADMVAEGASEFTAEASQTMTKLIYDNPDIFPLLGEAVSNGMHGALAGFFMGGVLGGAATTMEHQQHKQRRKEQGHVDVGVVDFGDGQNEIVEILSVDDDTNRATVLHNGAVEYVDKNAIGQSYRYSYEAFEAGRMKVQESEAIDNGNVTEGQLKASSDRTNAAATAFTDALRAAGTSEEEISTIIESENPLIFENDEVQKAYEEYKDARNRARELSVAYNKQMDTKRSIKQLDIEEAVGEQFWRDIPSENADGVTTWESLVTYATLQDGRRVYLFPSIDATETAGVTEDGQKVFVTPDMLVEGSEVTESLDAYLDNLISDEKKAAEQERMSQQTLGRTNEAKVAAQPGSQLNIGTAEEPVVGTVVQTTPDGVIVQSEAGVSQLSWEEYANAMSIGSTALTDEENASLEASEILSAESSYKAQQTTNPTEAEEVVVEATEAQTQAQAANIIPVKADGSVDQTTLWNQDPERWAQWNDEQRQDGGANSLAYINTAINKESAALAKKEKTYNDLSDFAARDQLELDIKKSRERLARLATLQQKYAPAEDVAPAATTSTQATPTESAPTEAEARSQRVMNTISSLYNDESLSESEIEDYIAANVAGSQADLDKHIAKAPKMGRDLDKYKADKEAYDAKTAELTAERDFWKEVQDYNTIPEIEMDMEPQNALEFTANELARKDGIKLQRDSFIRHTGYGSEAGSFLSLLRTNKNGGLTLEEAGERLMEMDRENNTGFFDQNDPNAGLNAILDVLGSARTSGDVSGYIRANREQMALEAATAARNAMAEQMVQPEIDTEFVSELEGDLPEDIFPDVAPLDEDMPDFETRLRTGQSSEDSVKFTEIKERAAAWAKRLGIKVNVLEDINQVEDATARDAISRGVTAPGWFDPKTGEVYIYAPHNPNLSEVDKTMIHEVISHKGLRGLLGKKAFNALCDSVWNLMDANTRAKYLTYENVLSKARLAEYNANPEAFEPTAKERRAAADEFIARYSESVNTDKNAWQKMIDSVKRFINKLTGKYTLGDQLDELIEASLARYEQIAKMELKGVVEEGVTYKGVMDAETGAMINPSANEQAEGNTALRAKDGTLVGMHNISEDKLRKAIKQGGLANPSTAVINIAEYSLEGFGDISLIMPSSLVDSETGDNAGTYTGDAWTPTYPTISRQVDDAGWKIIKDRIRAAVGESDALYHDIVNSVDNYLSDDRNSRLEFVFLKEKGIEPKIEMKGADGYVGLRNLEAILGVEGLRDGMESYEKYKAASPMAKRSFNMWQRVGGDKKAHKALKDEIRQYPQFAKLMGLDEDLTFAGFDSFTYSIFRKEYDAGNVDTVDTLGGASRYVDANDMRTEFDAWLESLMEEAGAKEVFFAGWTRDGDRIYKDNTLENVSRHMRMQGRTNAYNDHGLSATKSALLQRLTSLAEIRKNKARLQDESSYNKSYDELKDRLFSVISQLADMEKISDNPFMNIDYAEARLQDAIVKRNPISFLNKEYGYNIDPKGEYAEELKSFIKDVQKMPAKYFETKFERPVYLNEFAAAVMPNDTSEDVKQAITEAGLPIFEYDSAVEGARRETTLKAIEEEGVRFRILGEMGAANLDAAEEATTRLDNLDVARQMEEAGKDAKTIKLATGWERGVDNLWRYEVADEYNLADLEKRLQEELDNGAAKTWGIVYPSDLGQLLKEYPDFNVDIMVWVGDEFENTGAYSPATEGDENTFGRSASIEVEAKTIADVAPLLAHEIQHAIQEMEGFAEGGQARGLNDKLSAELDKRVATIKQLREEGRNEEADELMQMSKGLAEAVINNEDDAYGNYKKLAGEVEARNAATRIGKSLQERRESLLSETEDVAREDQIILMESLGVSEMSHKADAKMDTDKVVSKLGTQARSNESRSEINNIIDRASALVAGTSIAEQAKQRRRHEKERLELTQDLYSRILNNQFDDVTLRLIDKYIEDATPENPYGSRISQRLPQEMERGLFSGERASAVNALFSRVSEGAVSPSDRKSQSGKKKIEETKKNLLKNWAKATGMWYDSLSDVKEIADTTPFDEGTESKVYASTIDGYIIKTKKGKPYGKRFRPDIDDLSLFNYIFPDTAYHIIGYGDFGDGISTIVAQPAVVMSDEDVTTKERVGHMASIGMKPINKEKTAFSNGKIVASDIQGKNIVKDASGNIRVIDADMKLHTTDVGGEHVIPDVETDTKDKSIFFRVSNENQAIFVSNAAKAVEGIKQEKATPEQWLKMIEKAGGLKAGEDKWMGLSDWLKASDKKTLTKAEVLDFINENMIVIEEQHYSESYENDIFDSEVETKEALQQIFDEYIAESEDMNEDIFMKTHYNYAIQKLADELGYEAWNAPFVNDGAEIELDYSNDIETLKALRNRLGLTNVKDEREINSTRLDYTTEGLTGKHEIALTVPTIESWNESDDIHFGDAGEGRAVAWIRFGDAMKLLGTVEVEGKKKFNWAKVLVIDEIQSKRHQEGREKGYADERIVKINKRLSELTDKIYAAGLSQEEYEERQKLREELNSIPVVSAHLNAEYDMRDYERLTPPSKFSEERYQELKAIYDQTGEALRKAQRGIPDAPFDKNWHELAMKRMLRYAAENGYDVIAWTKGDQQAKRYNIGNVVEYIDVAPYEAENSSEVNGFDVSIATGGVSSLDLYVTESGEITSGQYGPEDLVGKQLSDVVGKDLAAKILSTDRSENSVRYEGEDFRIGGEGMKGFYDKMLPAFMNKYGKKWGVKVEDISFPGLENGLTMHSVPVTEEMKASVMEGQVMFRVRGENESAVEFCLAVANDITSKYRIDAKTRVAEVNEKNAKVLGYEDGVIDDIAVYLPDYNMIVIFAHEELDNSLDIECAVFHEINHKYYDNPSIGDWLWEYSDGVAYLADLKREIIEAYSKEGFSEAEQKEELYCETMAQAMSLGTMKAFYEKLPQEYKATVDKVLNEARYDKEREFTERIRRSAENNSGAESGSSELSGQKQESNGLQSGDEKQAGEDAAENNRVGTGAGTRLRVTEITPEVQDELEAIKASAIVMGNFMKAPNGKDTNLTEEQWLADLEGYVGNTELPDHVKALNEETNDEGPDNEPHFRTTGTPTEDVVAEGVSLSPAQLASLAGDIFAALPEDSRKKITDGLNGNILGLQDAILQIPTSLATKENWNDEDRQMAEVVAEQIAKAVGKEMTRPFSASEALWTLYNAVNKSTDLVSEASRALVRRNLGFDSQTLEMEDGARDGVRFRTVGDASDNAKAALYNKGAVNMWTRLKESLVDMHASVEEMVKAIEKKSGKVAQGFENVLLALNQQASKGDAAVKEYELRFLEPMLKEINKIMEAGGFKYEDVVRYVILKHGLERNDKFAKRDAREYYRAEYDKEVAAINANSSLSDAEKQAKIADAENEYNTHLSDIDAGFDLKYQEFRNNDYSGLSSMFYDTLGVNRKDYATEEEYQAALMSAKRDKYSSLMDIETAAENEVADFERAVNTDALWNRINAATKETLRQQYEANMISKDQYDSLRDMFEFYVPLRGFADNTAEDMYTYYRKPNSTGYTKPILAAEGRKTQAESPFGWIAAMAGSAIASNVKNEAKLALYYFVSNRPDNGIATITRTWFMDSGEVDADGKKIFKPAYPPFTEDLSTDAGKAAYEAWQQNMRDLRDKGMAYESGQRLSLGNAVVNISDAHKPEHIVNVKVGGKDYSIIINGNPRAAQAINGDLNIESTDSDYSALFGPMLRWMSSVNTSYNPEFWMTNFQRDIIFTFMAINAKEDPAYRRKFSKNYLKAFKVIKMVYQDKKGTLGDEYLEKMYKEFQEHGSKTGYTKIKSNEEWEEEITKYMKSHDPNRKKIGKFLQGTKDVFEYAHMFGNSLEQVSRFAAFLTSREMGKTIEESVNDAKEITVNFNRKGSGKRITFEEAKYLTDKNGQPLNIIEQAFAVGLSSISPLGRRFIMFFNASIQGLNSMYKLYKKSPRKMVGWTLAFAAIGAINALLHSMFDDDDDYLDMPEYERRNALMLGGNGVYLKWALPQEARAYYALGDLAVETLLGRSPHESFLGEAAKIGSELLPINPTEGKRAFLPSAAIPVVELWINEDYKGDPIYNDQKWLTDEEKKRTAKWSKAYQGTGKPYVSLSKVLNSMSGGDEYNAGWINIQPEKVQHLVQSAFGGTIRTADKFINSVIAGLDPKEEVTIRQLPFLNRFLTINDERYRNVHVNDVYDYYSAEAEHTIRLEKQYTKDRNADALKNLKSSEEYKWARIYSKYKKPIKKYQEKIRAAEGTAERMELMKQQDELKRKMIKEISEL